MNGYTLAINPSVAPSVIRDSVVVIIRTHTRKLARPVHSCDRKDVPRVNQETSLGTNPITEYAQFFF